MSSSQTNTLLSLYESPQTVFSIAGIGMMTDEQRDGVLAKRLNYYVKRGNLLNPHRGFYAKRNYNPEELACMLYTPSYISLEYVLQRSGVVFQYDSQITCVGYLSRSVEVDGVTFCYRRIKERVLVETRGILRRENINIAIPERAFLDVLYLNPQYYFDNLHVLDYGKVCELLPIYENKRMETRVKTLFQKRELSYGCQ